MSERDASGLMQIRAATINEEARTVEAILSTESRVEMFDWRNGDMVEEVLLAGGELPRQVPLLNAHSRGSVDVVLGSIRNIRAEGTDTIGTLHFAAGDVDAERAWNKVRQGHLTDVSVGYRVRESTEIRAGERATVNGKEWQASDKRRLRVATNWQLREGSLVPIGADELAKLRHDKGDEMAKEPEVKRGEEKPAEAIEQVRQEPAKPAAPQVDADAIRKEALEQERARVAAIEELAGSDVDASLVRQAVREGWDENRASREFLSHVRTSRAPQGGPAIHSRSHESSCTYRALAAGLLIGQGCNDPTKVKIDTVDGKGGPLRFQFSEQDADAGHGFRELSAIDIVRECIRMDGGTAPSSYRESIRAAMSGTHLDRVFTTNAYAKLIEGWMETPDTTAWCQSEDVPNFMSQEDITLRQNAGLDKHPRGATAKHADFSDDYETYKAHRFSKQFVADEQDFIDDRLAGLMQVPVEMGMAARRVHPDLVYSILLANAALTATGGALFNSTAETTSGGHANLTTAVLGSTGLKAGIVSMASKRLDGVPLNIRPRYVIVPSDLMFTGKELLNSAELRDTTATTIFTTMNVLSGENLTLVVEDRLGASGVTDPTTGTSYTGTATNWFLASTMRTVKKLYLRGTSRSPQMRSFVLSQGQWGMGWDINLDAGAAAIDYRGLHKSTGAG